MGGDKFNLKWNDFDKNFNCSLQDLRGEKELEDISLVSDTEQLGAHKVVLAASSTFFRTIITRNPHSHPLVYIKGITANNIKYVLDFIYNGEVNVAQEDLNSFLTAAEDLKIKGLTQKQQQDNSRPTATTSFRPIETQSKQEKAKQPLIKEKDDIFEISPCPVKHEALEANYFGNDDYIENTVAVQDDEIYDDASGYLEEKHMEYQPGVVPLQNEGMYSF